MSERLTVLDVIQRSSVFLEGKGVDNARLNAEWLIAAALGMNRMKLYLQFDRPLSDSELASMRSMVGRRAKREPLQYVLGSAPFHELELKVDRRALIPRPETEQLVEKVVDSIAEYDKEIRIVDLGTGSGAIALALAFALPKADILAVEAHPDTLELARENALHCGLQNRVRFAQSHWFEAIDEAERFDLIVSNPPYLTPEELESAEPEVRDHEPAGALVSGPEGLDDLREIVTASAARLVPGGQLWLETGIAQREALLGLCADCGYAESEGLDDWSGRPRFVRAVR